MDQGSVQMILRYCNFDLKYFEVSRIFEAIYTSQIYTESFCKLLVYEQLKPGAIAMIKDRNLIHVDRNQTDLTVTDTISLFLNAFDLRQSKFVQQPSNEAVVQYQWNYQDYVVILVALRCRCCLDEYQIILKDTRLQYKLVCEYQLKPYKFVYYSFKHHKIIYQQRKAFESVNLKDLNLKQVIDHTKNIIDLLK